MHMTFDKTLLTGNELIDTQHRELIERVNQLLESCEKGNGKRSAIQTLNFLIDYTVFHFEAEEKLQEETHFPDYEVHRAQHLAFIGSIRELLDMLEEEEGPTDAFVAAVQKNITEWLKNHIHILDKAVAEHMRSQSGEEVSSSK